MIVNSFSGDPMEGTTLSPLGSRNTPTTPLSIHPELPISRVLLAHQKAGLYNVMNICSLIGSKLGYLAVDLLQYHDVGENS